MVDTQAVQIELPGGGHVDGLLTLPDGAVALYVLAHGAGAGMAHRFLAETAEGLAERRIATLRYQFPFMQAGSKRPDRPPAAHAAVRAAVTMAAALTDLPLFAGGKSFGGRMTSQAEALQPLGVRGLVFLGFPLHPPEKPDMARAAHLASVRVPMLFIQGDRDTMARTDLVAGVVDGLGPVATLRRIAHADHGFDVLVRSGRTHAEVMAELLDAVAAWMAGAVDGWKAEA